MKTIILAGGRGTRLSEETNIIPKPMVQIGGQPIIWHIMQIYAKQGHQDFLLALGYLGDVIRDYVRNLPFAHSDLSVSTKTGKVELVSENFTQHLNVKTFETGLNTQTGGRILKVMESESDDVFMLTYGDGLGNVNIEKLLNFHSSHKKLVTVTAVHPPARFGNLELGSDFTVRNFAEKSQTAEGWINGGFFVIQREALKYFEGDHEIFEREVLNRVTQDGQLMAYTHNGFWQPMDTLREKEILSELASPGDQAPWFNFSN